MTARSQQSLRDFVSAVERTHPELVLRVTEPVEPSFQMQALALELERRRRFPVLFFEQVRGHSMPVISNVMASRRSRWCWSGPRSR
jgi:UbiD family decarboxylase